MKVKYNYRMRDDGSWEKYPVYLPETEEEMREAEEEALRTPGYYAGFSEVYANPDHVLHDRVMKDLKEQQKKEAEEAAKAKSGES